MIKKNNKKKVALFFTLVLCLCSLFGTNVFAAEEDNSVLENDLKITNFTIEPNAGNMRMMKGQNYGFDVGDGSGNVYGRVSGTVIFDYDGNKATVFSAGTPSVKKYDNNCTITATSSGGTQGTNAEVTIKVTIKKLIFSNSMTAKIKCAAGGAISIE